jgi:hypothetical protein
VITRVTQDIRARMFCLLSLPMRRLNATTLFLVDGPISLGFLWLNEINANMLIKAMAVVYLTPVFIFPCVIIAVVGARLGQVYMKAQIAIKREMSNAKAPVLGHFGAAVAGLSSFSFRCYALGGRH